MTEQKSCDCFALLEWCFRFFTNLEASINESAFQLLLHDSADQLSMTFPVIQGLIAADTLRSSANKNPAIGTIALIWAGALKHRPFAGIELTTSENSFVFQITHQLF